jgi:hypothetical protein
VQQHSALDATKNVYAGQSFLAVASTCMHNNWHIWTASEIWTMLYCARGLCQSHKNGRWFKYSTSSRINQQTAGIDLLHEELLAFHVYIAGEAKLVRLKGKRIIHAIFTCGGGAPLGFTYLWRQKLLPTNFIENREH